MISNVFGVYGQSVWMHPNRGQWDDRIEYKVDLNMGEMLVEQDGFTYFFSDGKQRHNHEHHGPAVAHDDDLIKSHVIKSKFTGSSWNGGTVIIDSSSFYRNYLQGSDRTKWRSNVHSYSFLHYPNYYQGIDLIMDGREESLKYSFLVHPNVDADQIKMTYSGHDSLFIDEIGNLHIRHRFGEIIEEAPTAWLEENHRKIQINFKLEGNNVRFDFPDGYDVSKTLIIDPTLTFSSYTGATADNWGMTATPDENGNLIAGGVIFGLGYPITLGAFDSTFNAGNIDAVVTKFNANGTALLFSTYLGGSGEETTNSLVCNTNNEVFIFGLTSSANFPMAGASFDVTFEGGPNVSFASNGLGFNAGTDLFIARLSSDGTTLIASTYVGGSGTDGLNDSGLNYNYGDQFRGEIIVDDNGFVYVSSTTQSADFPTLQGTQGALSGTQDAVLFKMPESLNSMVWSTFFGGTGIETGNSVQLASNGEVFIAGGTTSSSLPFVIGNDLNYGGNKDGYLARFNGNNGSILSGTYIGLGEYDQSYFVQLDIDDNVYVFGQTESDLGITPGHYGTSNSGQFIRKYDQNLNTLLWKTMIGAGSGHVEISPTAFLVSDCYDIYFSGWGGSLNQNSLATFSTTNGFDTTLGAWQTTTNGENFYIATLDQNAFNLKYGTFFGGTSATSPQHVDGGTSRFDKSGTIYHAVCAGCQGNSAGFTTTPGAWSQVNGSQNCNLGVFKFELNTISAVASAPQPVICLPDSVFFTNNSQNGNTFLWDFGDNTTSTDFNPIHVYPGPGNYIVSLVVSDSNNCYTPDSTQLDIVIGDLSGGIVPPSGPICPGETLQLEAYGGAFYAWSPAQFLDDSTIFNPTATLSQTTTFTVIISDTCGVDTVSVTVFVLSDIATISNDTTICIGSDVQLFATGGVNYEWTPPTFLNDPFSSTPISSPTNTTLYTVEITTTDGCVLTDSVNVEVLTSVPLPVMPDTLQLCSGESIEIIVSGGESYLWYPDLSISATDTNLVTVSPANSTTYYCDFTNLCGTATDSVFIEVVSVDVVAGNDTIICPGETATLWAQGGVSYVWSPSASLNNSTSPQVYATPISPTLYYVIGTDANGCTDADSVYVDVYPQPFIQTVPDAYAFEGDEVQLSATSATPGPFVWSPASYLTCTNCTSPIANPDQNFTYIVSYTDNNGCTASDSVTIFYDPVIWIPNTFTPDSDDFNNFFNAIGANIRSFEMLIFDRWGELICTLNDINESWDGTFKGKPCQDGTYIWKLKYVDLNNDEKIMTGHINLLR